MASEKRQQRVAEQIRKELGGILLREHGELAAQITVGEVRLSSDLSHANVFVAVMGDADKRETMLRQLMHRNKEIRRALAARLRIRAVPILRFLLDESLDRAEQVEELLRRIQSERAEEAGEAGGDPNPES
ncbi:MAG: 30S ribosome-binding factor RbfA [bacterium]|jgi:ribosome-binding factor A|nr:30S ribosome-binding factor RbfA [bacterium]